MVSRREEPTGERGRTEKEGKEESSCFESGKGFPLMNAPILMLGVNWRIWYFKKPLVLPGKRVSWNSWGQLASGRMGEDRPNDEILKQMKKIR